MKSIITKSQKKRIVKQIEYEGIKCDLIVKIRYDDQCGNGHNSFSITGDVYKAGRRGDAAYFMGGCIHETIEEHCPELQHLIKWHLCSSDEPMHYVANSMYHASSKDCHGLEKGEVRQIVNGRTGKKCWKLEPVDTDGNKITSTLNSYIDADEKPAGEVLHQYTPLCRIGEGKEPELDAARSSAIWPEAELKDFTEEALKARLPSLMQAFKRDVESLDFVY